MANGDIVSCHAPVVRDKASVDFNQMPCPHFISSPDDSSLMLSDELIRFLCLDSPVEGTMPTATIEEIMGQALRPSLQRVRESGVSETIRDVVFIDPSRNRKRADILLLPSTTENSERLCVGVVQDTTEVWHLSKNLSLVETELSIISQVSAQLGRTMETEEICKMMLIAVTAREGLGFNRAFLLFANDDESELEGHHAIGPLDAEEAGMIWSAIPDEGMDLRSIIRNYRRSISLERMPSDRLVRRIRIPVNDGSCALANCLRDRNPCIITSDEALSELSSVTYGLFGDTELAVAPLWSRNNAIGVIVADNKITRRPISETDLDQLQMFASQAAIAIERARLYENLQSYVVRLENANYQLEKTQAEKIKIERLSLMGELTYRIAHELRNPLTIIGGFASLLVRTGGLSEMAAERAAVIHNECRRIENQLNALLDFSRSYAQQCEELNLDELIDNAIDMLQPEFLELSTVLEHVPADSPVVVYARRDQLMHGLYTILNLLAEISQSQITWKVECRSVGQQSSITIVPGGEPGGDKQARHVMTKIAKVHTLKGDLRLALASEAISYNGGRIVFGDDNDRPKVQIVFEV